MKSTLVLYRKGLCGFSPVLGFALEEKLHGAKCCKFYGPEGVYISFLIVVFLLIGKLLYLTLYQIVRYIYSNTFLYST